MNQESVRRGCLTQAVALVSLYTLAWMTPLAASESPASEEFHPGPAIGEAIPPLEARDQDGKTRTFEDLAGPNGLLLLVHRSADW